MVISWAYLEHIFGISRAYLGHILSISLAHLGHIFGISGGVGGGWGGVGGGNHSFLNKQLKAGWESQNVFYTKGRLTVPKQMNFLKSSKRSLTPSPHFRKVILQIFRKIMPKKPCLKVQNLQNKFLD